ncbi:MAG: TetR/AcrR family transcriptional regulator [Acidimicrobiales bacterium]
MLTANETDRRPTAPQTSAAGVRARRENRSRRRALVLEAALGVIAEKGLDDTRMVDIGDAAGMSAGHVMYYFPTKAELLMQALGSSEDRFLAAAEQVARGGGSAAERLLGLVEISVPAAPREPAWILWFETWARAPHDPAVARFQQAIEERWVALLAGLIREGQRGGEFRPVDADGFARTLSALVDGLSIRLIGGAEMLSREELMETCRSYLRDALLEGAAHRARTP